MNTPSMQDHHYMDIALNKAQKAFHEGEVPVGALLVDKSGEIIAQAYNKVQEKNDATAHAELQVLQKSCRKKNSKYLIDCTLYVTLEPCPMCAMAAYWTQIKRLVFGAQDPKRGYQKHTPSLLHPKTGVTQGIYQYESQQLLQRFFQELRK